MKPLNGTKTHPLSQEALRTLAMIAKAPIPRYQINPGLVNRLMRESLIEEAPHAKNFRRGGMKLIAHLWITPAGKEALEKPKQGERE